MPRDADNTERRLQLLMSLPALLETLAASSNLAADDALAVALAHTDPAEAGPIVDIILRRGRVGGLARLVAVCHQLPAAEQRRLIAAADLLYGALRECCRLEDPQARLNACVIIRESGQCRLSYLLPVLLRDRAPKVREAAAAALRHVTDRFLVERDRRFAQWTSADAADGDVTQIEADAQSVAEDEHYLVEAVAAGLEAFGAHLHLPVVEAAMWLADSLRGRLWRAIEAPNGQVRRAVTEVLIRSFSPRLVPFAIEGLAIAPLRPVVLRVLESRAAETTLAAWLDQSWRLAIPAVRKGMRLIKQWPSLEALPARADGIDGRLQAAGVRAIVNTGVSLDAKLDFLERMLKHGAPAGRRAALWELCTLPVAGASVLLRHAAASSDPELARVARRELRRRAALTTAAADAAPQDEPARPTSELDRFWATCDTLSPEQRAARMQDLLASEANLATFIGGRLGHAEPHVRVKALGMLTGAGLAHLATDAVLRLSRDADPVVRSAAVSALGDIRTVASDAALRSALDDENHRVRANAVEALDRHAAAHTEPKVMEQLEDSDNRIRANAVKALLKVGVREAAESLCAMLADPDPAQRVSALWVVQELGLAPLVQRIRTLAEHDADSRVRERAATLLTILPPAAEPSRRSEVQPSTR